MNPHAWRSGTLPVLFAGLTFAATLGWSGMIQAFQYSAPAPGIAVTPAAAPATQEAAPAAQAPAPVTQEVAPAAQAPAPATQEAAPAAQAPAPATQEAAPAAQATAPASQEAAPPAVQTAAATTEVAAPAAESETAEATSEQDRTYRRGRYGYRARADRLREQRQKWTDLQREQRERWQSARRWWNNPAAENRRQWNKARYRALHDMAQERQRLYRQQRPYRPYGYRY